LWDHGASLIRDLHRDHPPRFYITASEAVGRETPMKGY